MTVCCVLLIGMRHAIFMSFCMDCDAPVNYANGAQMLRVVSISKVKRRCKVSGMEPCGAT